MHYYWHFPLDEARGFLAAEHFLESDGENGKVRGVVLDPDLRAAGHGQVSGCKPIEGAMLFPRYQRMEGRCEIHLLDPTEGRHSIQVGPNPFG